MLLEQLKMLECTLHHASRHHREWLEAILHQKFIEITRSGGVVHRAEVIDALVAEVDAPGILSSDFQLITSRDTIAILHYRTSNPDGSGQSLRSSTWERADTGEWKLIFHQGTPEADRRAI